MTKHNRNKDLNNIYTSKALVPYGSSFKKIDFKNKKFYSTYTSVKYKDRVTFKL